MLQPVTSPSGCHQAWTIQECSRNFAGLALGPPASAPRTAMANPRRALRRRRADRGRAAPLAVGGRRGARARGLRTLNGWARVCPWDAARELAPPQRVPASAGNIVSHCASHTVIYNSDLCLWAASNRLRKSRHCAPTERQELAAKTMPKPCAGHEPVSARAGIILLTTRGSRRAARSTLRRSVRAGAWRCAHTRPRVFSARATHRYRDCVPLSC